MIDDGLMMMDAMTLVDDDCAPVRHHPDESVLFGTPAGGGSLPLLWYSVPGTSTSRLQYKHLPVPLVYEFASAATYVYRYE